jgi:tRNA-binding EMAP/Myf-like protein
MYALPVIIGVIGAIAGRVNRVRRHPRGEFIWLADVDLGNVPLVQIVFGGGRPLVRNDLVPVAPPGSRAIVQYSDGLTRPKKMRTRTYRGERSHGMLCSLNELGWVHDGPNEVARLCDVTPGESLDELPVHRRAQVALDWEEANLMQKRAEENQKSTIQLAWLNLDPVREFC